MRVVNGRANLRQGLERINLGCLQEVAICPVGACAQITEKIRPTSHAAIAQPCARKEACAEPNADLVDVDFGGHVRFSL